MSAAYIQVLFRLDFSMEANYMSPDQTAPWDQSDLGPNNMNPDQTALNVNEHSDLGLVCLQDRLPKKICRGNDQTRHQKSVLAR